MDDKHLARIDNAMKFLVKTMAFPTRCAWDGLPWEERVKKSAEEEARIDEMVERIMQTGEPHPKSE